MWLTIRQLDGQTTTLEIAQAVVVGRDSANDVVLVDDKVSRRHAQLNPTPDGGVRLQDLGSTNGTFVNGDRLAGPITLRGGEEIKFGDTPASLSAEPPGTPAAPDATGDASADPRIGTMIGRYKIEAKIAEGAMGVVYLAEHTRMGRKVALKVLAPHLFQDPRSRQRFAEESKMASSLDHPNIIPVYDADEIPGGDLYIAMKYVKGEDLGRLLDSQGPLEVNRALNIVDQVARALDAAHASGLIHRDVKPGNVLVTSGEGTDEAEHVYLVDFGITKGANAEGLTNPGFAIGTRAYMAPEQFRGGPIDGRVDEYALGCMTYEILTGVRPFDRDSEEALMYAHLQEPVPSLGGRRPDLPPGLDAVIATAMAKDPNQRYATCGEYVAAARTAVGSAGGATVVGGVAPAVPAAATTVEPSEPASTGGQVAAAAAAGAIAGMAVGAAADLPGTVTDASPAAAAAAAPGTLPDMAAPAGPSGPPSGEGATAIGAAAPAAGTIPDYGAANVPTGPSATTPPYGTPVVPGGPPPPPGGPGGPGGTSKSKLPLIASITAGAIIVIAIGGFLATRGGGEPSPTPSRTTQSPTTGPTVVVEAPGTPEGLQARVLSQTEVLLLWQAPGSGGPVDAFEIFRDSTSVDQVAGGVFSYSDTSVEADTGYSYTVQGIGADGQRSDMSAAIDVTTPAPDVTPVDELLTHIPEAFRDTCEDPNFVPDNATAAQVCFPDDKVEVHYALYDNQADMTSDYQQFTSDIDYGATPDDCTDDGFSQRHWDYENGDPGGDRSCYVDENDQAWIEWTEENLLIYSFALRADGDYAALYDWWVSDSGPY